MINSWIVAQNLNFWFLHDALCFEKYNVGERRKIHHFRLLVKKARQAFRGTLKVAFLTYAPWSSWSQERREKSKRGVQSRAFFCVQESLRSLESCKIPYKYTKKPSLERDLMDEKPFVSCPGSSNIGLSIDFPRGNMSWDKTDKKSQYRTKNAKIWMIY